jgi:neutral amino acid transport system permease protein
MILAMIDSQALVLWAMGPGVLPFNWIGLVCPAQSTVLWRLLQLGVDGLAFGSLIALGALGLTLTYGILRLPNFAHGDLLTLGAYGALLASQLALPIALAIPTGVVITIAMGLLLEKTLWSPLRSQGAPMATLIIASMGLALVLRNGIQVIWGSGNQSYGLPLTPPITFFCLKLVSARLLIFGLALVMMMALHYLLHHTKFGKAMRAVADNLDLARITGINVERVILGTWILALGLTATAGGLYGLISAIRPNMGWFLILPLFAAVIVGGIGNPYGAIVGALMIGVAQELSTFWLPHGYKPAVALGIVMVSLLVRPQGLFGQGKS